MNLEQNIKKIEAELAEMKKQLKSNKEWKLPEYDDESIYIVAGDGQILRSNYNSYTKTGRRRARLELARICAKNSKQRDLLEAWAHHIDPYWRDGACGTTAYYIYKNDGDIYTVCADNGIRTLGAVYMSRCTAEKICEALNKGWIKI